METVNIHIDIDKITIFVYWNPAIYPLLGTLYGSALLIVLSEKNVVYHSDSGVKHPGFRSCLESYYFDPQINMHIVSLDIFLLHLSAPFFCCFVFRAETTCGFLDFKHIFWLKKVKMKVAQSFLTLCNPMDYTVNSLGQNTGVSTLPLLQGIFPTRGSNPGFPHCRRILYQLTHKGSSRLLEWVACLFSSGSSWP